VQCTLGLFHIVFLLFFSLIPFVILLKLKEPGMCCTCFCTITLYCYTLRSTEVRHSFITRRIIYYWLYAVHRKRWVLYPPSQTRCMYSTRIPYEESSVFSQVNVSSPDLRQHPLYKVRRYGRCAISFLKR